ncbi:MAG: TRAP transporter small permease [Desulfobacteraceae bacterium]|nr:MAG: TRAP transporter small permease [Desulfobacteraceae bacterium]
MKDAWRLVAEEYLLAVLLIVMVALNFTGVLCRYWLHLSLPWIEEVEVGLFIWMIFVAAGLTVVRDIHLGFSALVDRMPACVKEISQVCGRLVFLFLFALLSWFGARMVMNEVASDQRTPTLGWPEWTIGAAVPLGAAIGIWRIIGWIARRRSF